MLFMYHPSTTVEVEDYRTLREAWRRWGGPCSLVGCFTVRKPLTEAQLRRLPRALKAVLRQDDSVSFLERLYRLNDERNPQ